MDLRLPDNEHHRLFVYGTLRRRGAANHLIKQCKLLEEDVWVSGFSIFDAGWYPFAVPADDGSRIVGDVYDVSPESMKELDRYEGSEYEKMLLKDLNAFIYIKKDNLISSHCRIPGGDWLKYWKQKNG